jgi:hypothetical protein
MKEDELHHLLVSRFPLVVDPAERGDGRSYFLHAVDWRPASVTRIVRVFYDGQGDATRIRLCPSSDNNNSVFLELPVPEAVLIARIEAEIERFQRRAKAAHAPALAPVSSLTRSSSAASSRELPE